ncbi:MAG TPA: type II toxin-antitoxin system RelE/ParE family toxin [Candidatus Solibacter sp.]|nr:type II toxin-antitoxin system RelE/ParE family toxin [Candidatus Solibacter sp.]
MTVFLAPDASDDIAELLDWTIDQFGPRAETRYRQLVIQAIRDIGSDPMRAESQARPDISNRVRTYHLKFSRQRARTVFGIVANPRHLLVYRIEPARVVVLRVLHDSREVHRHVSDD